MPDALGCEGDSMIRLRPRLAPQSNQIRFDHQEMGVTSVRTALAKKGYLK